MNYPWIDVFVIFGMTIQKYIIMLNVPNSLYLYCKYIYSQYFLASVFHFYKNTNIFVGIFWLFYLCVLTNKSMFCIIYFTKYSRYSNKIYYDVLFFFVFIVMEQSLKYISDIYTWILINTQSITAQVLINRRKKYQITRTLYASAYVLAINLISLFFNNTLEPR